MGQKRNSALLAVVLAVLFVFHSLPVMAQEVNSSPCMDSGASAAPIIDSGEPPTSADTVATWEELARWMKQHQNSGGTVRLSAPIVCDAENVSFFFMAATTLDLGEYGLTVTGALELYSPYLTIKAKGGADASLRAAPNGYLSVTADAVVAGTDGPTLWQDEGGILLADCLPGDAAVHYAVQPVARAIESVVEPVRPGKNAQEVLPDTVAAEIVFQGLVRTDRQMPVVWDTSGEDVVDAIANRQRVKVSGRFDGAYTYRSLDSTLCFLNQPLTFLDVIAKKSRQCVMIRADFTHPSFPIKMEAEVSFDGETWTTAEADIDQENEIAELVMNVCDPGADSDGEVIWDTAQHPLLYLRIHWLDAENEEEAYSDTLTIDGATLEIASDPGGNRGGGIGLGPPELPPIAGGEDESGNEEEIGDEGDDTDTLPGKPEPPSNSNPPASKPPDNKKAPDSSIFFNGMPDGTEQSIPPTGAPIEPIPPEQFEDAVSRAEAQASTTTNSLTVQLPGEASQKDAMEAKPKAVGLPAPNALQETKEQEPHSQEPLASANLKAEGGELGHAAADSGAYPAKTAAGIAVGILAVGSIIALTMTWGSWGKGLLQILCSFRVKK